MRGGWAADAGIGPQRADAPSGLIFAHEREPLTPEVLDTLGQWLRVSMDVEPEDLGRMVRGTWVGWARQEPGAKPSWLAPWDQLDSGQKRADTLIGIRLFLLGMHAALGRQP